MERTDTYGTTDLVDGSELSEVLPEDLVLHILLEVGHVHAALVVFLVSPRFRPVRLDVVVLCVCVQTAVKDSTDRRR